MTTFTTVRRNIRQITSDIGGIARLVRDLPEFLAGRVTLQEAERRIKRELQDRQGRFLSSIRSAVFEQKNSPYSKLLQFVGCEYGDIETLVRRQGVDQTLKRLAAEGVYLTSDEFKGKKDVVRGTLSFPVRPADFDRLAWSGGYQTQSSGTTNEPVRSFVSLDLLSIRTPATCVAFAAHELFSHCHAMFDSVLPGSAGINNLLIYAKMGIRTDHWFARAVPIRTAAERLYHACATRLVVETARRCGVDFPRPDHVRTHELRKILQWLSSHRQPGRLLCITTAASNAARIARAADEQGIPLERTKFIVTGEPLTEAKRAIIEGRGARAIPRYAFGGSINIGYGCGSRIRTDEIHVNQHLLALIPNPHGSATLGRGIHPLLCTTIDPMFPRMLLNVESGDYGVFDSRDCGCPLGNAGLSLHLYNIRSFEKFTSEGMNYFYGDLYDLLEGVLPREFGGGPGDYQLEEEEDTAGQTRLTLVVHPQVGQVDEKRILARLGAELSRGSRGNRFMAQVWANSGTFRLKRAVPHASPRGKILPLHMTAHRSSHKAPDSHPQRL